MAARKMDPKDFQAFFQQITAEGAAAEAAERRAARERFNELVKLGQASR